MAAKRFAHPDFKLEDLTMQEFEKIRRNGSYGDSKPQFNPLSLLAIAIEQSEYQIVPLTELYDFISQYFPYYEHRVMSWRSTMFTWLNNSFRFARVIINPEEPNEYWWTLRTYCCNIPEELILKFEPRDRTAEKKASKEAFDRAERKQRVLEEKISKLPDFIIPGTYTYRLIELARSHPELNWQLEETVPWEEKQE